MLGQNPLGIEKVKMLADGNGDFTDSRVCFVPKEAKDLQ